MGALTQVDGLMGKSDKSKEHRILSAVSIDD